MPMERLISKYNVLLDDIEDLESEIEELRDSIETHTESLNTLSKSIESARETLGEDSPLIDKEIKRLLENAQEQNDRQVASVTQSKNALYEQMSKEKMKICKEARESIRGVDELQKIYDFIQEHSNIGDYPGKLEFTAIEDIPQLKARVQQLKEHISNYTKEVVSITERLSNVLSMKEIFKGINNPKIATLAMTLYIMLITVVICRLPVVFFAGYTTLTVKAIIDSAKNRDKLLNLQAEYTALKKSYNNCQISIEGEFDHKTAEMLEKIELSYQAQFNNIKLMLDTIQKQYENIVKDLENKRHDPAAIAKILESANSKLSMLLGREAKLDKARKSDEASLIEREEELEDLKEELKDLRAKIEELDSDELILGKSRILPNTIFTGFNSDKKANVIAHNGDALIICYSGETSDAVAPLALSIVTKMLTQLSIAAINIRVFDINRGAPAFAPYTADKLGDAIKICRTTDQIAECIKSIHSRVDYLSTEMYKIANNIQEYNTYMLSKNSLTMDYTILVVQDCGENLYKDPKFLQLCKIGPPLGIIPIIFISLNTLSNLSNGGSNSVAEGYYSVLTTIKSQFYKFDSVNGNIYPMDVRTREDYITSLEKLLRRK